MRAALARDQPDPVAHSGIAGQCAARAPASFPQTLPSSRVSPGTALLHRPAGILPTVDLAGGLGEGEAAATAALGVGKCVVDLSSLHLASEDRLLIGGALQGVIVAGAAVTDVILTCDHMRGLAVAAYTASLRADGTVERTSLPASRRACVSRPKHSRRPQHLSRWCAPANTATQPGKPS